MKGECKATICPLRRRQHDLLKQTTNRDGFAEGKATEQKPHPITISRKRCVIPVMLSA